MGSNPLINNAEGINCLHICASSNQIHILNYLLTKTSKVKGAVNTKSRDGWTPAHLAAFLGNFDSLNLLIEQGANLFDKHNHNMTVFDEII